MLILKKKRSVGNLVLIIYLAKQNLFISVYIYIISRNSNYLFLLFIRIKFLEIVAFMRVTQYPTNL